MALDGISERYAGLFAAMRPKAGNAGPDTSADFAAFLPDEATRAARAASTPNAGMTSRILQVGLHRYAEEKREVEKLMRVLDLVRSESDKEVKKHLDEIIRRFKESPPLNAADGLERIKKYIDELPNDEVKIRVKKAFDRIKALMEEPDEALERLEKEARASKVAATTSVFAASAPPTT